MIAVKVRGVGIDHSQSPLLLLMDEEENLVLPIGIGFSEAQAITTKLEGQLLSRPTTHDLVASICRKLGATISKIVVSDMIEDTYFAKIYLDHKGEELILDARPSDGVVLALTEGIPLYISDKVAKHSLPFQELALDNMEDLKEQGDAKLLH